MRKKSSHWLAIVATLAFACAAGLVLRKVSVFRSPASRPSGRRWSTPSPLEGGDLLARGCLRSL